MSKGHSQGQRFRCVYCGRDLLETVETFINATRDHLVPKSHGGPNGGKNRVLACRTCDSLKADAKVATVEEARAVIERHRRIWHNAFSLIQHQLRPGVFLLPTVEVLTEERERRKQDMAAVDSIGLTAVEMDAFVQAQSISDYAAQAVSP